ncbi:MAG: hypothetical protein FJW40_15660 [Acidobacteria bacterium]|nr:hypothetical protein [Acidobacteriota bacterium]
MKTNSRRARLLALSSLPAVVALAQSVASPVVPFTRFLEESAVPRAVIDRFLKGPSWARFDPELGYVPGNYLPADGMDKSSSISTVQANGARTQFVYAGRPSRINTYGDSFTHGDQVNDAETWQEYLAGHIGEPIRNFGVGGYGVYQAYRRMIREESTEHSAANLILYIWGDDHIRSLLRCRHALISKIWSDRGGTMFHANFWSHLEMNLSTGKLEEKPNPLNTPALLYRMTDPKFMADSLRDDLALQLYAFVRGYTKELDRESIDRLGTILGGPIDWTRPAAELPRQAQELLDRYAFEATRFTLAKAAEFAQKNGKKLLVVVFDPYRAMREWKEKGTRYDQPIVDFLRQQKFEYFDMNEVQLRDFENYRVPYDQYLKQYFIGHYNPRGNHFFAYSIKDRIVAWLDPKPVPYRPRDEESVDFKGYLNLDRR